MESFVTIPTLLRHVAANYHHARAFNERQESSWISYSTGSFIENVRRMALGLRAMGVKPGQSVGILADSSPWWLMADTAIMIAGGVSVPLFTTSSPASLKYKTRHAGIRLTFVCGSTAQQSYLDRGYRRFFSRAIVRGPQTHGSSISDERLMEMGDELSIQQPRLFQKMCDRARPDDVATIIYTSGTSGRPKGVALTHRNLISQIHAAGQWFPLDCACDRALSILPLAHAFERMVVYFCLSRGVSLWFTDPSKNLPAVMSQVKPTAVAVVPRVLEKIYASIVSQVESAGVLSKPLGRWAIRLAHSRDEHSPSHVISHGHGNGNGNGHGRSKNSGWALQDRLAEGLVYAKMRQALGGQLRTVICGGASLSPRLGRFFMNIGVPVYQGYGLTEASPVISVNRPGSDAYPIGNRLGTVGQALPGVEIRIGDHEEILARGPNIMHGYHRDPQATAQMIDADGWLHTGDQGRIDKDGFLTITGRIKDLCKTTGGKYVSPSQIERALTALPLVDQACVIAENRSCVTCLIFPDFKYLRQALGDELTNDLSDEQVASLPEVTQRIETAVEKINDGLEPWERIRQYRLIADELSVEDESLTPTQKLRRKQVVQRYRQLIDGMYSSPSSRLAHGSTDDNSSLMTQVDHEARDEDEFQDFRTSKQDSKKEDTQAIVETKGLSSREGEDGQLHIDDAVSADVDDSTDMDVDGAKITSRPPAAGIGHWAGPSLRGLSRFTTRLSWNRTVNANPDKASHSDKSPHVDQ